MFQRFGRKRAFDVNTSPLYSNIRERLAVATSALSATALGRGGAIRAEPDGEYVKFIVSATGESFNNVQEAFDAAEGMNLTEVISFGRKSHIPGSFGGEYSKLTNKYGAFAGIFEDITNKLANLTPDQIKMLTDAGIDIKDLKNLQLDIVTMSSSTSDAKTVVQRLAEIRETGQLHGITMLDDEGARVLSFRADKKALNTYQAHLLMTVTGHDVSDPKSLLDYMGKLNTSKIASMFEKSSKRMRAYVSARDMSLAGGELSSLIKKFNSKATNLSDISLVVDPQYEILMKYAHGDKGVESIIGADKSLYYRNLNADQTIDDILYGLKTKFSTRELDAFKKSIKKFGASEVKDGQWASDVLKDFLLKDYAGTNKKRATLIENIYKSIEQSYDGSDQMNSKFLGTYQAMLRNQIQDIDGKIPKLTGEQLQKAKAARAEISSLLDRIRNGELGQITGRGRIGLGALGDFNIKNAFDAREVFVQGLQKYGLVLNKFSLKKETAMAGQVESIILSGIGEYKDYVYADPVAAAFHPEVFADPDTLAGIRANGSQILQEYKKTLEDGVVPDKLKRILKKQAEMDIDILPANIRSSMARNREFARAVLEMLNAGMSPNDAPAMISMLHNSFATQAFREKGAFMQPTLPNTYRFAIDAEKAGTATDSKNTLGRGYEKFGGIRINGQTFAENAEILKFRVEGHKMMLSGPSIGKYFNSLGGFDLDDKGLPKLITYTDNKGKNRLGFYIFRQPSGPEEIIFARAQLDQQTIKSLFDNTHFRDELKKIMGEGASESSAYAGLSAALDAPSINELNQFRSDIRQLEGKTQYYGKQLKSKKLLYDERKKISAKLADANKKIANLQNQVNRYNAIDQTLIDNQAKVEDAIVDILGRMQNQGKTKLVRLTAEGASKIEKTGGASLALSDLVDELGNPLNAKFTRAGIYKTLLDEGAFNMSQDILDVLDRFNVNSSIKSKVEAVKKSGFSGEKQFEEILKILNNEPSEVASAIMSAAKESMQARGVMQSEGILGLYVNRSMVVGSTLNQYEALLESGQISDYAKNYMQKRYGIGMLAQETAIDLSVNFSRAKVLSEETARIIAAQYGGLDEEAVGKAISKMYNLSTTGAVTLEDIGAGMLSNLGKQIGFTRAIAKKGIADQDLLLGIDEFVLSEKMKGGDRMNILESIVLGMEDAKREVASGKMSKDLLYDTLGDDLAEAKKLLREPNDEKIKEYLLKNFAVKSSSRFASLSVLDEIARRQESFFEAVRKSYTAKIARDPSLTSAVTTLEEKAAAKFILDKHRSSLDSIFDLAYKSRKELVDTDLYDLRALLINTGGDVFKDIGAAIRTENVSMKGIITAFDQLAAQMNSRIDLSLFRTAFDNEGVDISEGISRLIEQVWQARRLRRIDFIERFNTQNAQGIIDLMRQNNNKLTADTVKERASALLSGSEDLEELQRNILKTLAEESDISGGELAQQQAKLEANIVRGLIDKEELSELGVIDQLTAKGTAGPIDSILGEAGITEELTSDMRRSIVDNLDDGVDKVAKYKRLTQKVFKEDLSEVLSNPLVKKTALGIGALVLGSFAYQGLKGRSTDDIQGPPLLPGGSAYESDFPMHAPQLPDFRNQGYESGINYRVNIYGDRSKIDQFSTAANGLGIGNSSTTMYSRMPDVARDQYSAIAGLF